MTISVPVSEEALKSAAIDLAHLHGWRVAHFRPARTKRGWRTAVEADGKGFPDLLLIRGRQIKVRECKVGYNSPTADQMAWLGAFSAANVDAGVWTEKDLPDRIVDDLRGVSEDVLR